MESSTMGSTTLEANWLSDALKHLIKPKNDLCRVAICAVEENHWAPELIADIFEIKSSNTDNWLR